MAHSTEARSQIIEELRRKLEGLESSFRSPTGEAADVLPSGIRPLNPLLPGGGLRNGSLVEWLADGEGSGACMLAFLMVRPWLGAG